MPGWVRCQPPTAWSSEGAQRRRPDRRRGRWSLGDLPRDVNGHECRMYRWGELAALLRRHGEIVVATATNCLSVQNDQALEEASEDQREQVLRWELEACREPGLVDAGTHILAVLRKPRAAS